MNGDTLVKGKTTATDIKSHWFEVKDPAGKLYYINSFLGSSAGEVTFNLSDAKSDTLGSIVIRDGVYAVRYVVTDRAGNRNDAPNYTNSTIHTITVDKTAPQVVGVVDYSLVGPGQYRARVVFNEDVSSADGWMPTGGPREYTRLISLLESGVAAFSDLAGNTTNVAFSAPAPSVTQDNNQAPNGGGSSLTGPVSRTTPPATEVGSRSSVIDNTAGDEEAGTVAGARALASNDNAEIASSEEGGVLGDSIEEEAAPGWLASNWYWILGVIAAGAGLWFIAGLRRRRNEEA